MGARTNFCAEDVPSEFIIDTWAACSAPNVFVRAALCQSNSIAALLVCHTWPSPPASMFMLATCATDSCSEKGVCVGRGKGIPRTHKVLPQIQGARSRLHAS